jgi:hypothetical protein
VPQEIPTSVIEAVVGRVGAVAVACSAQPITTGTGPATAAVTRLTGRARSRGQEHAFTLIRKEFRPLATGRHAAAATDERHWAYWRREPLAYASQLLPAGPGLAAPRCYGVVGDALYLQDVAGPAESPAVAAGRLGAWQANTPAPELSWLAGHQLAQRVAAGDLDWAAVDADARLAAIWSRRHELLAALRPVPRVLSHGDYHLGHLVAAGASTVVLDWATLGVAPVGADLAHLALSVLDDLVPDYLAGLHNRFDARAVQLGYRVTLALTGASRVHWMLSRGVPVPDRYADFVIDQARSLR